MKRTPLRYRRRRTLRLEWKPQDCWVGVFWKRSDQRLLTQAGPLTALDVWVCILPMLPIHYTSRLTAVHQ